MLLHIRNKGKGVREMEEVRFVPSKSEKTEMQTTVFRQRTQDLSIDMLFERYGLPVLHIAWQHFTLEGSCFSYESSEPHWEKVYHLSDTYMDAERRLIHALDDGLLYLSTAVEQRLHIFFGYYSLDIEEQEKLEDVMSIQVETLRSYKERIFFRTPLSERSSVRYLCVDIGDVEDEETQRMVQALGYLYTILDQQKTAKERADALVHIMAPVSLKYQSLDLYPGTTMEFKP